MKTTETKVSTLDRMKEILFVLSNLPPGAKITNDRLMKIMGIKSGGWNNIKSMLDTIITIQNGPKIERTYINKGMVTITYYESKPKED